MNREAKYPRARSALPAAVAAGVFCFSFIATSAVQAGGLDPLLRSQVRRILTELGFFSVTTSDGVQATASQRVYTESVLLVPSGAWPDYVDAETGGLSTAPDLGDGVLLPPQGGVVVSAVPGIDGNLVAGAGSFTSGIVKLGATSYLWAADLPGSPEGQLAAPAGTFFINEAGAGVFYKETGTGDTGWVELATAGASGWTDDGEVVATATATDAVQIGSSAAASNMIASIKGDATRHTIYVEPGASGSLYLQGDLQVNGTLFANSGTAFNHVHPATDDNYDLGSAALNWQELYVNSVKVQDVEFPVVSSAAGLGATHTIREAFSLAVDTDQTIYSSNFPFAARIVDVHIYVSTAIAARTITLRTATGGGGSALSDDFAASATGVKREVIKTATDTIAANSSLVIRSAGGTGTVVGEMIVTLVRE